EKIFFFNELRKEIKKISSNTSNINEIDFLQAGLKLLDHNDDCPFCQNSNISKNEIKSQVEENIKNYKEYTSKTKKLEEVASEIFEDLNIVFNNLFQLRNSLENEIQFSNDNFIEEEYNDVLIELRNTLINST